MPLTNIPENAKSVAIDAVITRANGDVVNLGTIVFWHKNPIFRWAWGIKNWLRVTLKLRPDLKGN